MDFNQFEEMQKNLSRESLTAMVITAVKIQCYFNMKDLQKYKNCNEVFFLAIVVIGIYFADYRLPFLSSRHAISTYNDTGFEHAVCKIFLCLRLA